MTHSCSPSGPALASILLTMLLAGEWGHMSVHPPVPGHSFQPLNLALNPSGLLILG